MDRTITQQFKVAGVLTDVTSAKLSDPTSTFGIKRNDTSAVVVADGTDLSHIATGTYEYVLDAIQGISYTAYIEFVFDGDTIFVEFDLPAITDDVGMLASFNSLRDRIGKHLYGIRTGFVGEQINEIKDCIQDGLHDVYTAHSWSFFRPVVPITTSPPYATGTVGIAAGVVTLTGGTWPSWSGTAVLRINDNYYEVSTRDSNSQLTLHDTSITEAPGATYQLGRVEYDLPVGFEGIAGDSDLNYSPGQSEFYRPITQRHDSEIRRMQQNDPYYSRPACYSIRTVQFDPTVGSRKRLALYPTPDATYVLRVPMILRPVMIDESNPYPIGGETLAQVILEACLAAAERNYDEQARLHTERFMQLLPLAIAADLEKSSPTSLGPDMPRGHRSYGSMSYDQLRASRIGTLTLDSDTL